MTPGWCLQYNRQSRPSATLAWRQAKSTGCSRWVLSFKTAWSESRTSWTPFLILMRQRVSLPLTISMLDLFISFPPLPFFLLHAFPVDNMFNILAKLQQILLYQLIIIINFRGLKENKLSRFCQMISFHSAMLLCYDLHSTSHTLFIKPRSSLRIKANLPFCIWWSVFMTTVKHVVNICEIMNFFV